MSHIPLLIYIYTSILIRTSISTSNFLNVPKIRVTGLNEGRYFSSLSTNDGPTVNFTFSNDTVYQVPSAIGQLILECNATYPVMWNLADSDINSESFPYIRVRSMRSALDIFDTSTFNYTTQLVLESVGNSHKLSGNYSCQSTARRTIQSNVFIFWQSPALVTFIHSKETVTVYLEKGRVTLPCGVSSPISSTSKRPKLQKLPAKNRPRDLPEDLRINGSISYDSGKGFTFDKLPFPVGTFKCSVDDHDKSLDYVNVVVSGLNATAIQMKKLSSNATFTYNHQTNEIVCCSSSRRAPNIVLLHCDHAITCQFREHVVEPYHYIFSRSSKTGSCAKKQVRYYHTSLIRCVGDGIDEYKEIISPVTSMYQPYENNPNQTNFFSWEQIEPQEMLVVAVRSSSMSRSMYRYNPDFGRDGIIYSTQPITAECRTSAYYFSEGTYWAIKFKNKTLTPVKKPETAWIDMHRLDYGYSGRSRDNLETVVDISMEALVCFAPVWNSSVWITKSYFLYINETISPIMRPIKTLDFTWYTNETKELTCEATGTPYPTFTWSHGDMTLNQGSHNYNFTLLKINKTKTMRSTIKINRVSYSTHGVFTCTASNYGGTVSQTFNIQVLDQPSWRTTTILVISGVVVVVLVAILIVFLRRMKQDKKAIQHLTSVHFKDPTIRENAVGTDVTNSNYDRAKTTNQLIH